MTRWSERKQSQSERQARKWHRDAFNEWVLDNLTHEPDTTGSYRGPAFALDTKGNLVLGDDRGRMVK